MKHLYLLWALLIACQAAFAAGPHFIDTKSEETPDFNGEIKILFCSAGSYVKMQPSSQNGYQQSFPYYLEQLAKDPSVLPYLRILLIDPVWKDLNAYKESDLKHYLDKTFAKDEKLRDAIEDKIYFYPGFLRAPNIAEWDFDSGAKRPFTMTTPQQIDSDTSPHWVLELATKIAQSGGIVIFDAADPKFTYPQLATLYNRTRSFAKNKENVQFINTEIQWYTEAPVDDLLEALWYIRSNFALDVSQGKAQPTKEDFLKTIFTMSRARWGKIFTARLPGHYAMPTAIKAGSLVYNVKTDKQEPITDDFLLNAEIPYVSITVDPKDTAKVPLLTYTIDKTDKGHWKLVPSINRQEQQKLWSSSWNQIFSKTSDGSAITPLAQALAQLN